MVPFEQLVEQAELLEDAQGRGMDRVAAEIAQEIVMLLEHRRAAAGAGEEQPRYHPGGPAADDDEVAFAVSCRRHRAGMASDRTSGNPLACSSAAFAA